MYSDIRRFVQDREVVYRSLGYLQYCLLVNGLVWGSGPGFVLNKNDGVISMCQVNLHKDWNGMMPLWPTVPVDLQLSILT